MAAINPYSTGTPYFSKQVFLDTSNTVKRIVIQTAAPLVLAQGKDYDAYLKFGGTGDVFELPDDGHLEAYADDLSLYGTIKLPGRNVTLVARTLKCLRRLPGDNDLSSFPSIDVSGVDGPAQQFPDGLGPGAPAKDDPNNTKGKIGYSRAQGEAGQANRIEPFPSANDVDTPGGPGPGRTAGLAYDPVWDGEPGDDGAPGGNAGSITIIADTVSQYAGQQLPAGKLGSNRLITLTANGGKGGDGQRGQGGGSAGNGGYGASSRRAVDEYWWTKATDGGRGGDGGNGGKGGKGGQGGNSGAIILQSRSGVDRLTFSASTSNTPGAPGTPGPGGFPGHKGSGGQGGSGYDPPHVLFTVAVKVARGNDGSDGNDGQFGVGGDLGMAGTQAATLIDLRKPWVTDDTILQRLRQLARIDQLQMMVERTRAAYLSVDISNLTQDTWTGLGDTLKWIQRVLIDFPTTRWDGSNCQDDHDLAQRLKDIVDAMLVNHANQCDYFGKSRWFVPTLSLSTYDSALTKTLACLSVLEKTRATILSRLAANEVALADARDGKQEAAAASAYLTQKLTDTTALRRQAQRDLQTATDELESSRNTVRDALKDFEDKVYGSFGLDTPQLLNALTQVAFTGLPVEKKNADPGAAGGGFDLSPVHAVNSAIMGGIQLAETIDSGNKNVLNDGGEQVSKQFVVKQIVNAGDDLKATLSQWKSDGSIGVDQNGMTQLASRREQFDDLAKNFSKTPGANTAKAQLDGFVDDADARNKLIANYNDLLMREYAILGEIQKCKLQESQFDTRVSLSQNPGLAHIGMWMSNLYELVKASCLDELYMEHRAEAFWATKPYSSIQTLLPGTSIEVVDQAAIKSAQTQVSSNILSHLQQAFATQSRFPLATELNATGAVVALTPETHPSLFEDLRSSDVKKRGDTKLPAAIKVRFDLPVATSTSDVTNAFHGKADVRLTKVRPYLIGLKTSSDHTVTIIHSGTETIQSQDDKPLKFMHDPRSIPFTYSPDPAWPTAPSDPVHANVGAGTQVAAPPDWRSMLAKVTDRAGGELDLPTSDAQLVNAGYAPIGPFTTWRLVIKYTDYDDLDLTGLSAIVIDFHGFFRAFN